MIEISIFLSQSWARFFIFFPTSGKWFSQNSGECISLKAILNTTINAGSTVVLWTSARYANPLGGLRHCDGDISSSCDASEMCISAT